MPSVITILGGVEGDFHPDAKQRTETPKFGVCEAPGSRLPFLHASRGTTPPKIPNDSVNKLDMYSCDKNGETLHSLKSKH